MKKIINGKRYDTETAKELNYWANHGNRRDFSWCKETLFQKKTGEFFLYGEGGPMSRYAERVDNSGWAGGEDLIPLTWEEARKWAEEKLTADEYEEIFGEVSEDDSKVIVTLSLPAHAAARLKKIAARTNQNQSDLIASLIMNDAAYTVFITGGKDDGKEIGWFEDEMDAIKFANAYMDENEDKLDPVCGGVCVRNNRTEEIVENW